MTHRGGSSQTAGLQEFLREKGHLENFLKVFFLDLLVDP